MNYKNCTYVLESMYELKHFENSFRDHGSPCGNITPNKILSQRYFRDTNFPRHSEQDNSFGVSVSLLFPRIETL